MKNFMCSLTISNEFNLATFIVGILSLCGVIINIIVTSQHNKNKRYTDLITQHRITTMEKMMNVSSNLIKSLYSIMANGCDYNKNLQTFVECKSQIFYFINYKGYAEIEMRNALNALEQLILKYSQNYSKLTEKQKNAIYETVETGSNYYQMLSSLYSKCEWQRAKLTSLSVKEKYDTEEAFKRYMEPMKDKLDQQKQVLITNTFEKIVKQK